MPEYLVSVSPSADVGVEMPPARIVVDVSLDGSARKLIDVRSALLVENRLLQPVELKLENTALKGRCCSVLSCEIRAKRTSLAML